MISSRKGILALRYQNVPRHSAACTTYMQRLSVCANSCEQQKHIIDEHRVVSAVEHFVGEVPERAECTPFRTGHRALAWEAPSSSCARHDARTTTRLEDFDNDMRQLRLLRPQDRSSDPIHG